MATHAMYNDLDSVKRNFIRNNYPYYLVCDSKNEIIWINDSEDNIDEAALMLVDDLKSIRPYNSAIFTIKHFAKVPNNGFKKTSEADCISTFKQSNVEEIKENYTTDKFALQNEMIRTLKMMQEDMQQLKMRLELEDSEPDEKIENEMSGVGLVGRVLENPQVINLLTNVCANLFTNNIAPNQIKALAGVENDTLENIIEKLFNKGVTVEDLNILANKPENEIKFLLTLLRK
jgi:hypothetical protein